MQTQLPPPRENNQQPQTQAAGVPRVSSLSASSFSYLAAKIELASIEAQEAAELAKKRFSTSIIAAFVGFFSYALCLICIYLACKEVAGGYIEKIAKNFNISGDLLIVTVLLMFHLLLLIIIMIAMSFRGNTEIFALTKSELAKDKQWLETLSKRGN